MVLVAQHERKDTTVETQTDVTVRYGLLCRTTDYNTESSMSVDFPPWWINVIMRKLVQTLSPHATWAYGTGALEIQHSGPRRHLGIMR